MSNPSNFNRASIFQVGFPTISEDFFFRGLTLSQRKSKRSPMEVWSSPPNQYKWAISLDKPFPVASGSPSTVSSRQGLICRGAHWPIEAKPRPCVSKHPSKPWARSTFEELRKVSRKVQRTPVGSGSSYDRGKAGKFQGNTHRVLLRLIISSPWPHLFWKLHFTPTTTSLLSCVSTKMNFCIIATLLPLNSLWISSHLQCMFYPPHWISLREANVLAVMLSFSLVFFIHHSIHYHNAHDY